MTDWLGLRGRAALVAGAGGIGAAVALALARAGARVAVTDVDEQRLGALARDAGVELTTVAADLTSAAAAGRAVRDAAETLGGLDVFVHAVGVNDRRPVLETPDEVWDRLTRLVPAGRLGTADDLTGPILFLCSAQSTFVTGHVMYADGGRTLV